MRAPQLNTFRHRVSALTAFSSLFLRTPAANRSSQQRAGNSDGKLLSPRENGNVAIRLSRTYW